MASWTTVLAILSLASTVLAKTDLSGCTTSNVIVNGGASVLWYVPGSGEICAPLDCGGGRAPPKTNVPGCAAYSGTAAYSPSFIPGYGAPATTTQSYGPPSGAPTGPPSGAPTACPSGPSILPYMPSNRPTMTMTFYPSSTLVTLPLSVTGLSDTTSTLDAATGSASGSLITSAIIYDTSAASSPVTNAISVTSSSSLQAIATAMGNDASRHSMTGGQAVAAALAAAAGIALF